MAHNPGEPTQLLDLPNEMIREITKAIVDVCGIREGVRCRAVCKIFDQTIQDAIYELPTFNDADALMPRHLLRNHLVSVSFKGKLVVAKLKGRNPEARPITGTILAVEKFAAAHESQACRSFAPDVKRALSFALVRHGSLYQIVRGLTPKEWELEDYQAAHYLLIAAIKVQNRSVIRVLLLDRRNIYCMTNDGFGDPLVAAVRTRDMNIVQPILDILSTFQGNLTDIFARRKRGEFHWMHALREAAADGSVQIVQALLGLTNYSPTLWKYEFAGTEAAKRGFIKILTLLSQQRCFLNTLPRFWRGHLETAVVYGQLETVRFIVGRMQALGVDGDEYYDAFQDTVRLRFTDAMKAILPHIRHWARGSLLFWAVRSWDEYIIRTITDEVDWYDSFRAWEGFGAAIAGAMDDADVPVGQPRRLKYPDRLSRLSEILDSDVLFSHSDTFGVALDRWMRHQPQGFDEDAPSDFEDPRDGTIRDIVRRLSILLEQGPMDHIHRCVSEFARGHSTNQQHAWEHCINSAIRRDSPAILYRFLEVLPLNELMEYEAVESVGTDILQILLDHQPEHYQRHDMLTACMEDRRRAMWMLRHPRVPKVKGAHEMTTLTWALHKAEPSIIQQLFDWGFEPKHGQLLHGAAARNDEFEGMIACEWLMACDYPVTENIAAMGIQTGGAWDTHHTEACGECGTPLHMAVYYEQEVLASYLVRIGVDVWARDTAGKLALDYLQRMDIFEPVLRNAMGLLSPEDAAAHGLQ